MLKEERKAYRILVRNRKSLDFVEDTNVKRRMKLKRLVEKKV